MEKLMTPKKFSLAVEQVVQECGCSHMEAVLDYCEKNNIEPNRPVWETGSKRHHPVFRTRNVRLAGRVAIFSQNETNAYH